MANNYLSDAEALEDLVDRIESEDKAQFHAFRHLRTEGAFIGRIYVVYRPTGLNKMGQHNPPQIITQIRVRSFAMDAATGAKMVIEDLRTGASQEIGYIPERCFHYDFFVGVPPYSRVRWDARRNEDGSISRSMNFGILFKTRSRAEFYSMGCMCAETPNNFRRLYPDVALNLLYA